MPLERQAVLLKMRWGGSTTSGRDLTWLGRLRPTEYSPAYSVRLRYELHMRPRVAVLDPPLDPGTGKHLPHIYAPDDLCLYTTGDWNATMALAETIVPWTAEWLFHYEAWLVTGVWSGGGGTLVPKPEPDADGGDVDGVAQRHSRLRH